jgi:outer membrane protein OmpA-like peptidoglycan-associated protein
VITAAEKKRAAIADSGSVALYGIKFDSGEEIVLPDSQGTLEEIAKLLKKDPQLKLRIVGHTDDQGSAEHNLDLSSRRAASVVRELTKTYGIAAGRLDSFDGGFYAPVALNATREGRALNQRVELVRIGVWSC